MAGRHLVDGTDKHIVEHNSIDDNVIPHSPYIALDFTQFTASTEWNGRCDAAVRILNSMRESRVQSPVALVLVCKFAVHVMIIIKWLARVRVVQKSLEKCTHGGDHWKWPLFQFYTFSLFLSSKKTDAITSPMYRLICERKMAAIDELFTCAIPTLSSLVVIVLPFFDFERWPLMAIEEIHKHTTLWS